MQYLVFALFVAGVGFYVFRSYAAMGKRGRQKALGLEPNEYVKHEWPAELDVEISTGQRVGAAVQGLVAGALVGGVGVGTVHAPGVSFVITTAGRLLVRVEEQPGRMTSISVRPHEVTFDVIGPGSRKVNGLPSIVLRVGFRTRPAIEVLTNEAYVPLLGEWQRA